MRILLLLCLIIFFSCQKPAGTSIPPDPSPTPTPIVSDKLDNLVTSITIHNLTDHIYNIDSFEYNTNNRIAIFHSWSYDSTQTPALTDSTLMKFFFQPNDSLPYQYSITKKIDRNNFYSNEVHQLIYDALRRIEMDSLINPANNMLQVNKYTYANNSFVVNFYKTDSTAGNTIMLYESDTSYIASGNIDHESNASIYYNPAKTFIYFYYYKYSALVNPFYFESTAKTIAPLFQNVLYADFTSKNMLLSIEEFGDPASQPIFSSITWTTDAKGRVIAGIDDTNSFTYKFRYKN